MTETLAGVSPSNTEELLEQPSLAEAAVAGAVVAKGTNEVDDLGGLAEPSEEELAIARELVRSARSRGVAMTGPGGMLKALTKTVIETALDEEMTDHLGYDRHDRAGHGSGNSRNGTRSKTVLTDNVGPVTVEVPRDRDSTFDPVIVKKRQRRLGGVDTIVLSLVAKGLTTGEVSAHFEEIYGASLSKDTISRITDRVIGEMTGGWPVRWSRSTPRCSSTRSMSRSAMGRSPTDRSTSRSGLIWPVARTSSAYGPAPGVGSRRSSGCRCSLSCATAASRTSSSSSATG